MRQLLMQIVRGIGYTGALIVPAWLFFGPVAAFHHMVRCGILTPIFLDGESPRGEIVWEVFGEHFTVIVRPIQFVVSLVLWAVSFYVWIRIVTRLGHNGQQSDRANRVPRWRAGLGSSS